MELANRILSRRGLGDMRVNMYMLSSAESEKFVKSVEDAFDKVQMEGHNPIKLNLKEIESTNPPN
ncbi:MAG: hypothetical protein GF311_15775 [Candidatus Lokiarchaeota archaeon]|nr:hypothetical protein [Candidatus Lokiarchaeota archaeon]